MGKKIGRQSEIFKVHPAPNENAVNLNKKMLISCWKPPSNRDRAIRNVCVNVSKQMQNSIAVIGSIFRRSVLFSQKTPVRPAPEETLSQAPTETSSRNSPVTAPDQL